MHAARGITAVRGDRAQGPAAAEPRGLAVVAP